MPTRRVRPPAARGSRRASRLAILGLAALSLLLYANTLTYDYALDDGLYISQNRFTTSGLSGLGGIFSRDSFAGTFGEQNILPGGRYRPLPLAMFAVEWQLFGRSPFVGHLINVVLHALTVLLLYRLCSTRFFPGRIGVSFLAAAVFALHPIHTEVVANIKGREDLLVLLFFLLTLDLLFRGEWKAGKSRYLLALFTFALALLSKETAVAYLPLIGLALWVFSREPLRRVILRWLPFAALTALFLLVRFRITAAVQPIQPDILNDPYLLAPPGGKYATILLVLGRYLLLLFWPAVMSHDYSYDQIPLTGFGNPWVWVSVALHLALLVFVVLRLPRRSPFAFAGAVYLITIFIVSNIPVSIGAPMADRFLYPPSLGLAIAAGAALARAGGSRRSSLRRLEGARLLGAGALALLLLLAGWRTVTRNRDWRSNETLFLRDVQVAPRSTQTQAEAGSQLMQLATRATDGGRKRGLFRDAVSHLRRSLEIYPDNGNALMDLGTCYRLVGRTAAAESTWARYAALRPDDPIVSTFGKYLANSYYAEGVSLLRGGKPAESVDRLRRAAAHQPDDARIQSALGRALESTGDLDGAIASYVRATTLDAGNADDWFRLGESYRKTGRPEEAREAWRRALEVNPGLESARRRLNGAGNGGP